MTSTSPRPSDSAIRVTTGQHPITLTNPDAVVAAIPYLLGFRPEMSVVLLWVTDGRLTLTQRVDLPKLEHSAQEQEDYLNALLVPGWDTQADSLIACVVSGRALASHGAGGPRHRKGPGLVHYDLIASLVPRLDDLGLHLLDALLTQQMSDGSQRWWSYLCQDDCCPEQGREVPETIQGAIAAAFTMEGVAVADSRADVARSLESDPSLVAQVMAVLPRRSIPTQHERLERWRTARLRRIRDLLGLHNRVAGPIEASQVDPRLPPLNVHQIGDVLQGVDDTRVRDCVLWSLSRANDLQSVIPRLTQCLRAAPDQWVPPVATCVAVATWLAGDGARASMALERALAVEPSYSLARLLDLALRSGMPPRRWAAMMASLSEDECRGGTQDQGDLPPAAVAL